MTRGLRWLHNTFVVSVAVTGVLMFAGFVSFYLAWRATARVVSVPQQLSFLVSGGIGGIALLGFGIGMCSIQLRRRAEGRAREQLQRVLLMATDVLSEARKGTQR